MTTAHRRNSLETNVDKAGWAGLDAGDNRQCVTRSVQTVSSRQTHHSAAATVETVAEGRMWCNQSTDRYKCCQIYIAPLLNVHQSTVKKFTALCCGQVQVFGLSETSQLWLLLCVPRSWSVVKYSSFIVKYATCVYDELTQQICCAKFSNRWTSWQPTSNEWNKRKLKHVISKCLRNGTLSKANARPKRGLFLNKDIQPKTGKWRNAIVWGWKQWALNTRRQCSQFQKRVLKTKHRVRLRWRQRIVRLSCTSPIIRLTWKSILVLEPC